MPISDYHHIPTVLYFALALCPRSVLDVGVGTGTYGFLLRQLLDLDGACSNWADRRVRIEGIEIFEPYRNSVWDLAYDRVHIGDARILLRTLGRYDLVMMNDVLEHFIRSEARALVRQGLECAKTVIATTPNRECPQGAWAGNDAETHRSQLDATDFPHLVAEIPIGITTCFVCSTDSNTIARVRAVSPFCPVARVPLLSRVKRRAVRTVAQATKRARDGWRKLPASLRDRSG